VAVKTVSSLATKAATTVTTAYASGWSLDVDVGYLDSITVLYTYVNDSGTRLDFLLAFSRDDSTFYDVKKSTGTPPPAELSDDETQITVSANASFAVRYDVSDVRYVRIKAKGVGVVAGDTLAAEVIGGGGRNA